MSDEGKLHRTSLGQIEDIGVDVDSFLKGKGISKPEISVVEEWRSQDRSSAEGIRDFYTTSFGYIFTLLWLSSARYPIRDAAAVRAVEVMAGDKEFAILDYGCGLGNVGFSLASRGYQVTFADLDTLTFEFIEWRCQKYSINADFITLPCDIQKSFDMIICLEVLEHLRDPKELLENFSRMLNCEGRMIISESMGDRSNPLHVYRKHAGKDVIPIWMRELRMRPTVFFDIWEMSDKKD